MDGDSGQNCSGSLSFLLCKMGLPAVRFQLSSCPPHLINDTANTVSKDISGDSLVVWWLRLHAPSAGEPGFIPWSGN